MTAKPSLLRSIVYLFQGFELVQIRSGTLALLVALLGLTWLNSPWGATYLPLRDAPVSLAVGTLSLSRPLSFWVNHVLMAGFFLVMGLELKRALRVGEMAHWRDAAFPVAAALGAMAVPAGIYIYLNPGSWQSGWAIPMVTDVAAVLALLSLVGSRVPLALRFFLSSLAILQTLVTFILSVIFYTSVTNLLMLSVATGLFGLLVVLRALRNRSMWLYLLLGLVMLGAFLLAGISGIVAGILLALVIPVHSRVPEEEFISTADTVMGQLHALHMIKRPGPGEEIEEDYQAAVHTLHTNCRKALSPLRKLQQRLLPWVGYGILPLFALVNAAFAYNSFMWQELLGPVPMGIFLGLVLGKPVGILLFAWLATLLRIARKPPTIHWLQVAGTGLLAGAGFMMSLLLAVNYIASSQLLTLVKISIYCASLVSGLAGLILMAFTVKDQ